MVMGTAFERAGKLAEALAAFDRCVAILQKLADANPDVTQWQSELAVGLGFGGGIHLKAGRTAQAAASLRRAVAIWNRLSSRSPGALYNLACVRAELAGLGSKPGSGMTAAEGREELDRAMESLRQAVAAGYRKLSVLRTDPDLDPLRSRPDFQVLMMDLVMPDNAFAVELWPRTDRPRLTTPIAGTAPKTRSNPGSSRARKTARSIELEVAFQLRSSVKSTKSCGMMPSPTRIALCSVSSTGAMPTYCCVHP